MDSKTPPCLPKHPTSAQIEKKLPLSLGLFETAFKIKKHPEKSERELNRMTMALFEKGAK